MSVELFVTYLDFLTKLQAVFDLDDFILNFNVGGNFFSKAINVHVLLFGTLEYTNFESRIFFTIFLCFLFLRDQFILSKDSLQPIDLHGSPVSPLTYVELKSMDPINCSISNH